MKAHLGRQKGRYRAEKKSIRVKFARGAKLGIFGEERTHVPKSYRANDRAAALRVRTLPRAQTDSLTKGEGRKRDGKIPLVLDGVRGRSPSISHRQRGKLGKGRGVFSSLHAGTLRENYARSPIVRAERIGTLVDWVGSSFARGGWTLLQHPP